MKNLVAKSGVLVFVFLAVCEPSVADLSVALPIADRAVVQRRVVVPVRGSAEPGETVELRFAGGSHRTQADAGGVWVVELPPLSAGGPYEMVVRSGDETLRLRDLLVGDVWLCSGQSNMEWVVADSLDAEREIAAADDRSIRHFKVPRSWAAAPQSDLAGGVWEAADPERVGGFTAVGYFFARSLRPHVRVPIGLLNSTWGGSRIEAWMSARALDLDEEGVDRVFRQEREDAQRILEEIRQRVGDLPTEERGLIGDDAPWAQPGLDDSGWHDIRVPSLWEEDGWPGMDGVAWYRASFELTAREAAMGVRLGLAAIDDSDRTWVNGHLVGETELAWNRQRVYDVPPRALVAGRNVVAVRVEDTGGGGGIHGDPEAVFVEVDGARRPLAGDWKFQLGIVALNLEDRKRDVPTVLYNRMIHPLQLFPLRGVLWYQGESNAWGEDAPIYRHRFRRMIADWRRGWGQGPLPFLFVQLASFMAPVDEPGGSDWAVLRESQAAALALPRTAQAVAIDAGEADDVHPRDKQTIGHRLALAARRVAYGEEIEHSGPVLRRHRVADGRVILELDHVASGLVAKGSTDGWLHEFAVAGEDRRFVAARARIDGDRIVVWSDRVAEPSAVRYAWADNPEHANLTNGEGLPAAPFRTDDWPAGAPPEDTAEPEEPPEEAGEENAAAAGRTSGDW